MFLNNRQKQKTLRKSLRNNATPQEVILWSRLRNSQLGCKFRRQASIGDYVVDFFCPQKKLAIELDGSQHIDSKSDQDRTSFLNAQGVQVLRFWNDEINTNIDSVLLKIEVTLQERTTTPTPP